MKVRQKQESVIKKKSDVDCSVMVDRQCTD